MDAIEVFDTGRQRGDMCPCTEGSWVPDENCDICFGAGFIYTDSEGNVIGNFARGDV